MSVFTRISDRGHLELNPRISTLDASNMYSESSALLCALHSGMLNEILDEDCLFTTFGRMSTGSFSYNIAIDGSSLQHSVHVEKSQCEIDGGFESLSKYALLEVKTGDKDDFIIRQLFYPYRLWKGRTNKEVIPIFLTVSNEIFSFYIFRFKDPQVYNSLEFVQGQRFCISRPGITIEDIKDILTETQGRGVENKNIAFPQADSFPRVIDLLGKMNESQVAIEKEAVTTEYAFDSRQTDYYLNAALYLGVIQRGEDKLYSLNNIGAEIMASHPKKRYLKLAKRILLQPAFHATLSRYLELGEEPSREEIVELIRIMRPDVSSKKKGWKTTTIERRAQTVIAWIRWILELTNPMH